MNITSCHIYGTAHFDTIARHNSTAAHGDHTGAIVEEVGGVAARVAIALVTTPHHDDDPVVHLHSPVRDNSRLHSTLTGTTGLHAHHMPHLVSEGSYVAVEDGAGKFTGVKQLPELPSGAELPDLTDRITLHRSQPVRDNALYITDTSVTGIGPAAELVQGVTGSSLVVVATNQDTLCEQVGNLTAAQRSCITVLCNLPEAIGLYHTIRNNDRWLPGSQLGPGAESASSGLVSAGFHDSLVTDESRTVCVTTAGGTVHTFSPRYVDPAVVTGAGDLFCGVYLGCRIRGLDTLGSLDCASTAGAVHVSGGPRPRG